jgi:CBS domain-containing protein
MTIGQFARTDVVTAPMDATVPDLARIMKTEGVGSVVVVSDDAPVGIVTDRDLVVYGLAADTDPAGLTASDLMAEDLFAVDAEMGLFAALGHMRDAGVRRVPVTADGDLVGIVTLDDLVVVLANELNQLAGVIEAESLPY